MEQRSGRDRRVTQLLNWRTTPYSNLALQDDEVRPAIPDRRSGKDRREKRKIAYTLRSLRPD